MSGDSANHATVIVLGSSLNQLSKRQILPSNEVRNGQRYELEISAFSNDGKTLAAAWDRVDADETKSDGSVELLDGDTGLLLRQCAGPFHVPTYAYGPYDGSLPELTFSPNGKLLAGHDELGRIVLWDVQSGCIIGDLSVTQPANKPDPDSFDGSGGIAASISMVFTPDGRGLAVSCGDGDIYLYSLQSHTAVAKIGKAAKRLSWMGFSTDGRRLYGYTDRQAFAPQDSDTRSRDLLEWSIPIGANV